MSFGSATLLVTDLTGWCARLSLIQMCDVCFARLPLYYPNLINFDMISINRKEYLFLRENLSEVFSCPCHFKKSFISRFFFQFLFVRETTRNVFLVNIKYRTYIYWYTSFLWYIGIANKSFWAQNVFLACVFSGFIFCRV